MRTATHFLTLGSDGTSHARPLVTNRPASPACPGCRHCRPSEPDAAYSAAVGAQAAAELERRSAARFDFVRGIMDAPAGESALDR
jgi:hypothetical protein